MAIGFGAEAQRYAERFPIEFPLIAAGVDGCVAALEATAQWRKAGRIFGVAPLIDDPLALLAQRVSGRWMSRLTNIDERYRAFDALGADRLTEAGVEVTADDLLVCSEPERRVLRDVAIMGDTLVVRSQREADRVARILKRRRPEIITVPAEDATVPRLTARPGDTIVVWAPHMPAEVLGVIAMALEYMRCPVVYVCHSGMLANVRGAFVQAPVGARALSQAACIIDASIGDPGSGIALARIGLPVVTASTSGAAEFLSGALEYDPWDWRTVFAAVASARGAPGPLCMLKSSPFEEPAKALSRAEVRARTTGPLVSVVVLTYNRRPLLRLALDSIARQRYDKIEIIVVNNGGADVSDIVSQYANARLLTLPVNILPNAGVEHGFEACVGEYFSVLSDDDEFFPDHFSKLVDALERSSDAIAHSNTLTRYLSLEDDARDTLAYRVLSDRPADRLQILVGGTMTFHSMLFRKDVRTRIGGLRVDLAPADYEYMVRAAQHFDFVHVDAVTCEWNYAVNGSSYTFRDNIYEDLKVIYEEYSALNSTIVETRRAYELARFESRRSGAILWPPDLLLVDKKPT